MTATEMLPRDKWREIFASTDAIDNMLDEHAVEGALRDSLAYDIGLLLLPLLSKIQDLSAGSNYIANDDTHPTEVRFANGRVVRLSKDHTHLVVERTP